MPRGGARGLGRSLSDPRTLPRLLNEVTLVRMRACERCGRIEECHLASEVTMLPSYADGGPFCGECLAWWLGVENEDEDGNPPTLPPTEAWLAYEKTCCAADAD